MILRVLHADRGVMQGWLRRCCALALLMFAQAARAALLAAPVDLHADGEQAMARGKPLIILFSFPGCVYCKVVRQNYLLPLVRDLPVRQQPVVREVEINSGVNLIGFNRERLTQQALAQQYKVRVAPTVLFVDGAGKLLAPAIIGGDTAGLYGGYLDNAFAESETKLNKRARAETSGGDK